MRQCRLLQDNASYHVSARTNNKEFLLNTVFARDLFEKTLVRAKKKFGFQVKNFVIMENHFHLIIRPTGLDSLSKIMQWILSVFAMLYNKIFGRSGHFWGSRFFSKIIESLLQYLRIFFYIDLNPIKANLVDDPKEWQHSGISHLFHNKKILLD